MEIIKIETPKSETVLAYLRLQFSGIDWKITQDSLDLSTQYQAYEGRFPGVANSFLTKLTVQYNGCMSELRLPGLILFRSENVQGRTYQQAINELRTKTIEIHAAIGSGLFGFGVETGGRPQAKNCNSLAELDEHSRRNQALPEHMRSSTSVRGVRID